MWSDIKISRTDKFNALTLLMWLIWKNVILMTLDIIADVSMGINIIMNIEDSKEIGIILLTLPFLPGIILALKTLYDMLRKQESIKNGLKKIPIVFLFPLYQLIANTKATSNIINGNDEEENMKFVTKLKLLQATLEAFPAFFLQVPLVITSNSNFQLIFSVFSLTLSFISITVTAISFSETKNKILKVLCFPLIAAILGFCIFLLLFFSLYLGFSGTINRHTTMFTHIMLFIFCYMGPGLLFFFTLFCFKEKSIL